RTPARGRRAGRGERLRARSRGRGRRRGRGRARARARGPPARAGAAALRHGFPENSPGTVLTAPRASPSLFVILTYWLEMRGAVPARITAVATATAVATTTTTVAGAVSASSPVSEGARMIEFGTGGWRAIIGDEFTRENVRLLAQGLADRMHAEGVV